MRAQGADVSLAVDDFDAANAEARCFAAASGLPFVEDGVEPRLSGCAGSMAVELLAGPKRLDTVLVSTGKRAILGGTAHWIAAHAPGGGSDRRRPDRYPPQGG